MARERAMRVRTFRVMPRKYMGMKAEMTQMGRVRPVMTVERQELRKQKTMKTVRRPPRMRVVWTSWTDSRMMSGAVAHHLDLDARRELLLELGHLLLDPVHGVHHVGLGLLLDVQGHGGDAVDEGEGALLLDAVHHLGHLAEGDGVAASLGDDHGGEALHRLGLARDAHGHLAEPRFKRPRGVFTFSRAMPARTSSTPRPMAWVLAGSTLMFTSRFRPPTSLALPTPGMFSRRRRMRRSVRVVRSLADMVSERTAREMMGVAWRSSFWMTGSSMPWGSSLRMPLILARASSAASLTFTFSSNSTMTLERPSREVDWTCFTPGMGFTASSMRRLTSRSTVSGLAPG